MKNSLIEAVVGAIFGVVIILTSALTSADLAVIVLGALLSVASLIYIYVCVKKVQVCCCEEAKPAKTTKKATTKKPAKKTVKK